MFFTDTNTSIVSLYPVVQTELIFRWLLVTGGVAAGIANMDIALVSTMVGLFSIGFFAGGLFGGQMVRSSAMRVNLRSSYVSLAAGSLLVMLGVSQLTGA